MPSASPDASASGLKSANAASSGKAPRSKPSSARLATSGAPSEASGTAAGPTASAVGASPERASLTLPGHPSDLVPLTTVEEGWIEKNCADYAVALNTVRESAKSEKEREEAELSEKAKAALPKGADGKRCVDLTQRMLDGIFATKIEKEAILLMSEIANGLQAAYDRDKTICPSAGPTPKEMMQQGRKWIGATEYTDSPGWKCASFRPIDPQWYQYEVTTDAKAKRFQVVAKGYPLRKRGKLSVLVFEAPFREKGDPEWDKAIQRK